MKLWQKIFLCTLGLVILGVNIITMVVLTNQHKLLVEQSQKSALSGHEYVVANIKNSILYERLRQNVVMFQKDQVIDIIEQLLEKDVGKDNYNTTEMNGITLYCDSTSVYENGQQMRSLAEPLREVVSSSQSHHIQIKGVGKNTFMLVGSMISLEGKKYVLVTSFDVTEIFNMYNKQLIFIKKISIYSGFLIAGILLVVIRFLLLPLQEINEGTRHIARGKYHTRIKSKRNDELSELANNMNIMASAIEEKVKSLEDVAQNRKIFIANLGHEMKTPLTSILGFAEILRIKRNVSEEERQEYAGIIADEAKRMRTLSGKLMELISVENSQPDWEEVHVADILNEVIAALTPVAENNGLTLLADLQDAYITIDKELFKSLLYNIVDNAMKASKIGDEIHISGKSEGLHVVIIIADHGIGIAKEDLLKINEPFYMVDKSRTRKSGGAGLGLALCTEIVKIHFAEMSVGSELGKGTTVTIKMKGRQI